MARLTAEQMEINLVKTTELIPYANNSRTHSDEQVNQIAASIKEFGFNNPILIDEDNGIIAGHGRLMAAKKLGIDTLPCVRLGHLTEAQRKAYIIADNKLALNADWDFELLQIEIKNLKDLDFDVELLGFDDELLEFEQDGSEQLGSNGSLSDRFLIPPFSVINTREAWWQQRRDYWLSLGIKSELGRDSGLAYGTAMQQPDDYGRKAAYENKIGKKLTWDEYYAEQPNDNTLKTTSIFDPCLCELAYTWFCPKNGVVIDPFAGGSVRGVVASFLGRQYVGCELRPEQVQANIENADDICIDPMPAWINVDSRNIDTVCGDVEADMLFSCPPYVDLEVYSDDPSDLSTLNYSDFKDAYCEIIKKTCSLLKDDSFAVFVVGDVRDKKGLYYNFVGDTTKAFLDAGLSYYNEAILVTTVGNLPIRAGRAFKSSRKIGKTHQNILVFCKGDPNKATERCGDVYIHSPEDEE